MSLINFEVDVSQLVAFAGRAAGASAAVDRAAVHVVAETTDKVTEAAKALVPVRTGALKASIHGEAHGLTGEVDADIRYAPYVEFGTYKDAPQPFMMPALEANEAPFEVAMELEVGNAIEAAL